MRTFIALAALAILAAIGFAGAQTADNISEGTAMELTDYQKGVYDGMKAGLYVGELKGAAPYNMGKAMDYNNAIGEFDGYLNAIFGENSVEAIFLWQNPASVEVGAPYSRAIVHAIDGSWNIKMDAGPERIKGMPAGAYYTTYGGNESAAFTEDLGGV